MSKHLIGIMKTRFWRAGICVSLIVLLINSCSQKPTTTFTIQRLDSLTLEQIEKINLTRLTIDDYFAIVTYADELAKDSVHSEQRFKGQMLLSVSSDALKKEIEQSRLNPKTEKSKVVISKLEQWKYYPYRPKESNFDKIIRHLRDKDFHYLYKRFKVEWYFIPAILLVSAGFIFFLLNLIGVINWRHRRLVNKMAFSILIGFSILILCLFYFNFSR